MKKLLLVWIVLLSLGACSESEPEKYTGRELAYQLFKSSEYDFTGNLLVKELTGGWLEFNLKLNGAKSTVDYQYPAHLHFGTYDQADTPIAYMLNPVSAKSLESVTGLGKLSNGTQLDFEAMRLFNGHVKIHLASDGPDYKVILVSGNVGGNSTAFDPQRIAICGNEF
jgi:hypothetical protein